jgi:two-component system, response regulator PdtaR
MKKVLVVEDDQILAIVQTRYLQKMGFMVVASVSNGLAAINAVKELSPDIIIMDVRIEGEMDGVDTMKEIQKFSSVPVIYSTGNSEPSILNKATETNMKGFLVKPINYNELEELINKALG